jgi:site-specific recombinase XerD
MFLGKNHEQTILEISQGDYINATADSFLIDRQARELSKHTLRFYREFLRTFIEYCNTNSLTFIQEITPDLLRRYFLAFGEKHNPGGVHGAYRTLRAFFQWLMKEEVMASDWKNPMLKVKAPKVILDPLEPISIQDVRALLNTCQRGDLIGERDRALFLFLLDTGARAREACSMNIKDVDLNTGAVMIRYGKGGKTRMVFIGRTTRRATRAYLRLRHDPRPALFISKDEKRLTYDGLRQLLERRAKRAN